MKVICKDDYVFEVDIEENLNYYKTHSLCECDYCQNYYSQIKGKFPKLEKFLSEFGVEISNPDEIMSIELNDSIEYLNVDYTICGKIITMGKYEIDIYDNLFLSVVVTDGYASPNSQKGDYFTLSIYNIKLPWGLDKPFPKPMQDIMHEKATGFFNKLKKQINKLR